MVPLCSAHNGDGVNNSEWTSRSTSNFGHTNVFDANFERSNVSFLVLFVRSSVTFLRLTIIFSTIFRLNKYISMTRGCRRIFYTIELTISLNEYFNRATTVGPLMLCLDKEHKIRSVDLSHFIKQLTAYSRITNSLQ